MAQVREQRFGFEVNWYDQQADIIRNYRLFYYPVTNSIEMYDIKKNCPFLKRQQIPEIKLDDFHQGGQVTVLSRVLTVMDYSDVMTRTHFENNRSRTFAVIKPDVYMEMGKIIDIIYSGGFKINRLKMSRFNNNSCNEFYKEHIGKAFYPGLAAHMTGDVSVGLELVAADAVSAWRDFIGPTMVADARAQAPNSIRGRFGSDGTGKNAVHGSDSAGSYKRESSFFFGDGMRTSDRPMKTTAVINNCTLCIIKPHILAEGRVGQVIDMILAAGFEISAMELFNLSRPVVEEFLDVYKGVLPEYLPLIEHLSNGPSIALEVRQENAVASFRDLCGPHDPEIAKHLRPNTIRAKFGEDRVRNAVHCTDMSEDGELEVRYFFSHLQQNV